MAEAGDVCFCDFYTTCVKGSQCRFRHCEKAIHSDTVCSLWREGRCSHQLCKFRHMEIQQKYNSISCFWETQPLGCVRISCVFHHRKPRNINGLFLPPSIDFTLQREVQEGILHPTPSQDYTKGQESTLRPIYPPLITLRPIHPPLIITINLEDEDEEEQEEKYASYLLSPEDIEEEKAIKEVCYKSGEYYRIQTSQKNNLAKITPLVLDSETLKPMETGRNLQEGDGVAVPSKFNIIERPTKMTASLDSKSKSDHSVIEHGGGDCYLPQRRILIGEMQSKMFRREKEFAVIKCSNIKATSHAEGLKKQHFKGVKKKKWISENPNNLSTPLPAKAMHTSSSKGKGNVHQNAQSKNAENASNVPSQKANGKNISSRPPTAGRSSNLACGKAAASKESKMNLPTEQGAAAHNAGAHNAPVWRKRIPRSKVYAKAEKVLSEPRKNGTK